MVLYWGRRGLSRFALDLAKAMPGGRPFGSFCFTNEMFANIEAYFGDRFCPVDTFDNDIGSVFSAWKIPLIRRHLAKFLNLHRPAFVLDVIPHIWMPFVLPVFKKCGVPYIAISHDAVVHPGDYRSRLAKWANNHTLKRANHVIALSRAVADELHKRDIVKEDDISVLFHPDLRLGKLDNRERASVNSCQPIRIAFLGRILPYKGLSLFVELVSRLRSEGCKLDCGVFGEGALGSDAEKLRILGAEVINRWLLESEIDDICQRYDVLVACHTEASQSGVVSLAMGASLPVIASPVGGLIEQIEHNETGIIASAPTVAALADAVHHLFNTKGLYSYIVANIDKRRSERSMDSFAKSIVQICGNY